jgi:hypothetical protein
MKPDFSCSRRHLALALCLVLGACACAPASRWNAPAGETPSVPAFTNPLPLAVEPDDGPGTHSSTNVGGNDPDAGEENDGPQEAVPQSEEARAIAYRENMVTAQRFIMTHGMDGPGRRDRTGGGRGRPSPGLIFVCVIAAVVGLRVLTAARRPKPAGTLPMPLPPAPAVLTSRQIVTLACDRCSRVLDLPRERAGRRVFCPRCGALMAAATNA